jgi:hypothetical protein
MKESIITKLHFNWYSTDENGEEYRERELGKDGVTRIRQVYAKHYEVYYEDGRKEQIHAGNYSISELREVPDETILF